MTLTAAVSGGGDDGAAAWQRASNNGTATPSDASPRVSVLNVMETVEEVRRGAAPRRASQRADGNCRSPRPAVARAPCARRPG
jgi:hypothetical protein